VITELRLHADKAASYRHFADGEPMSGAGPRVRRGNEFEPNSNMVAARARAAMMGLASGRYTSEDKMPDQVPGMRVQDAYDCSDAGVANLRGRGRINYGARSRYRAEGPPRPGVETYEATCSM
jgi:hypothetical protein